MLKLTRAKKAWFAIAVLTVAISTAGMILALHWPFSQPRVKRSLQEAFPATVTFQKFHSTYFPHPGCVGEGVVFIWLGTSRNARPIVTIRRFAIEANYTDLFLRPSYLARIVMEGFRVQVPPIGTAREPKGWKEPAPTTRVGEIIADGAVIEIARADNNEPLRFDVHTLKLTSVGRDKPLSYEVALHNPLPPGEIRVHGQFGPWNSGKPGETLVSGEAGFQNADLGVFNEIAGKLTSAQEFRGKLKCIETQGRFDVPDFMVTRSKHAVHLASEFHAFVDGTNGDVELGRVAAVFLNTRVLAKGKVAGRTGEDGKTAVVDLAVREGRVQDVLRMFIREAKPPLNGVTSFRAQVTIPPGKRAFL